MVRYVYIRGLGAARGGFSLAQHTVKEYTALCRQVFDSYNMDDHAFDLHFDTSNEDGACDFPISETSWNSYGYFPGDNSDKLTIYAHFTPKIRPQRASTVGRPHERQHASTVEEPQHDVLRTPPAKRRIEESHGRHPQSGPDRTDQNTRRVGRDTVYSYTDVDPSIKTVDTVESGTKTVETVESGRRVLIGYLRRPGSNKNLVYASVDSKLAYIHRRAVCFNMQAQRVDIGGGTSVGHRDTVYFREFADVANDNSALLEEVRRRIGQGDGNGAGAPNTATPLRNRDNTRNSSYQISPTPLDAEEASRDATRTAERSATSSTSKTHSKSSGTILVRFIFKEGTQGIFRDWNPFEIQLLSDAPADYIAAQVDEKLKSKARRSTRVHMYRDDLRAEIRLGVNEKSMMLLRPRSVLSDYVTRQSDGRTDLLGHVLVHIYKDGRYVRALEDIHDTNTVPKRKKQGISSDTGSDTDLEEQGRIHRPRRAQGIRSDVVDLSSDDYVLAKFEFTAYGEAANLVKNWSDLRISFTAETTYEQAMDLLRPAVVARLRKSKIDYDPQSVEHVPFMFRLARRGTSRPEPLMPGQSLREFVRDTGRELRLFGEIQLDLTHATPAAQDEADVPMAGPTPRGQVNGNTAARAMQGNIRSPTEESYFESFAQPRRASSSEA